MEEQFNCKTGMTPNIIGKEIFEKETELCKKSSKENGGSGVIPCLYKLHKGEITDEADKVKELKNRFLKA